ncbi:MAG: hypothetical protein QOI98_1706 [Solirubrobacteraceae bacterium]|nr:hypothetical protein [Solirubrobacteraceae bacterium]
MTAPAGPAVDQQTLLVRRGIALGLGVLLVILFALGIKGCLNSRKDRSLKDYNREVYALVQDSKTKVSEPFFGLVAGARGKSPLDVETQVNQFRVVAEEQVRNARNLSTPGDMKPVQRNLLLLLDLRTEALAKTADKIRTALGDQGADTAVNEIAGQMQSFLASDVLYSQRVSPLLVEILAGNGIKGQPIATHANFLPSLDWLDPGTVGARLRRGGTSRTTIAPGTHGHALTAVSVGNRALVPGSVANRIPATPSLAFDVKFQNQGTNDEVDVTVRVRITGAGKPIVASKRIDQTKAGTPGQVSVTLSQSPPIGTPVTITVEVLGVPGEKTKDNNKQTYTAFFTRA